MIAGQTPYIWLITLGLAAGLLSGMFGVGGGVVIVMGLTALGLDQKVATGTSLAALALPIGVILACAEYNRRGEVRPLWALVIVLAMVLGGFLGARLTSPMSPALLKRLFGVFLIVMGLKNLWNIETLGAIRVKNSHTHHEKNTWSTQAQK